MASLSSERLHCELPNRLASTLQLAAAEHSTPLYVYNLDTVKERCAALTAAVQAAGANAISPDGDAASVEQPSSSSSNLNFALLYALKANNSQPMVRTILSSPGFAGVDCVS